MENIRFVTWREGVWNFSVSWISGKHNKIQPSFTQSKTAFYRNLCLKYLICWLLHYSQPIPMLYDRMAFEECYLLLFRNVWSMLCTFQWHHYRLWVCRNPGGGISCVESVRSPIKSMCKQRECTKTQAQSKSMTRVNLTFVLNVNSTFSFTH